MAGNETSMRVPRISMGPKSRLNLSGMAMGEGMHSTRYGVGMTGDGEWSVLDWP